MDSVVQIDYQLFWRRPSTFLLRSYLRQAVCLELLNITKDETNIREVLKTFKFRIYQKTSPIIGYCWLERTNRV